MTKQMIRLVRRDDKGLEPELMIGLSRVPCVGELVLVPVFGADPSVYLVDGVAHRLGSMGLNADQEVEAIIFATKKADGEPKPASWL